MIYRISIDLVIFSHLCFIVFVVFGGFLLLVNKKWALVHFPAVVWGTLVEFLDLYCPLTPLENWLRKIGGEYVYHVSFIEQYLLPIIYPHELTRELQILLGVSVVAINICIYLFVFLHKKRLKS